MRAAVCNFVGMGVPYGTAPTPAVSSLFPAADPAYPIAALFDKATSPVFKWAALENAYVLDVSTNVVPDGDGSQATVPADWVVTGGTLTRFVGIGVDPHHYLLSLQPDAPGLGAVSARCDVTVPAGTYWQFAAHVCGGSAGRVGRIAVIDLERGGTYYLAADGTWSTSPMWLASTDQRPWTEVVVEEFRVPTFAEWGRRSGKLRILFESPAHATDSGDVDMDEVLLFPTKLDVVAFVGHNFPSDSILRVLSFGDRWWGGPGTYHWETEAVGAMRQPIGWVCQPEAPITSPCLRLTVQLPNGGIASRYPQIGELFLGRTIAFPRSVRPGWRTEWKEDQPRQQTRGGLWTTRSQQYPPRRIPISMDLDGESASLEWPSLRDDVMIASGMGVDPSLLLPARDTEPDWCLYGNFADSLQLVRKDPHQELEWEFQERPVPLIG